MTPEEAKAVVERAIASGLAKQPAPSPVVIEVSPKREKQEPKPATTLGERACPQCNRVVKTVDGRMPNHRSGTDRRGHANGPWCDYNELGEIKGKPMNTTTAMIPVAPALELTATTPSEMQTANAELIEWCSQKISAMKHDAAELAESFAIAVRQKWQTKTLKRHADLAAKRVTFYEKIKAALESGYCIVPNFPVTLFAIRTDKTKPAALFTCTEHYGKPHYAKRQEPKLLTAGEGEYQNPNPAVQETHTDDVVDARGNKKQVWTSEAVDWREMDFPINMAKPKIMEATSRAMALKVFDEMGILPDPHPKKDPLIVGRILDPKPTGYGPQKFITFIVAWHLNVRDI